MPRFGNQIDAMKIPIKGLVAEGGTTAPASPVNGQLWFDESVKKLKARQDGNWVTLDTNTTYSSGSKGHVDAGTDLVPRVWSPSVIRQIIEAYVPVKSVAGKTGDVAVTKADVGLSNVDNTSDANKPVSSAVQTELDGKANWNHQHGTADVVGLQGYVDDRIVTLAPPVDLSGLETDISNLEGSLAGLGDELSALEGALEDSFPIGTTQISDEAISTPKLAAEAITAGKISAGAITTEKLYAGAVTTEKVHAGAIVAESIASEAITAEKIAARAITASRIATGTITAEELATGSVTADKIDADAINGKHITGATIDGGEINGVEVNGVTINGGTINGTEFWSDKDTSATRCVGTKFGEFGVYRWNSAPSARTRTGGVSSTPGGIFIEGGTSSYVGAAINLHEHSGTYGIFDAGIARITASKVELVAVQSALQDASLKGRALTGNGYDTGWEALSLGSGWTGSVEYRIIGGVVYLRGRASRSSGSNNTITTLPAVARPASAVYCYARSGTQTNININTGGTIVAGSGYSTGNNVEFSSLPPYPLD